MVKLPKELAEWHYSKLIALHDFEYLTLAQKVSIFYHDLEHDILKKITGKKDYFEQYKWLKDNRIHFERNVKTGEIPKINISDIDNLKNWRNECVHENNMPEPKYKSHFHTMAQIIFFFSEISIPDEINDILNNQQKKSISKKKEGISKKGNNALGKHKSIEIVNRELSLNIKSDDTSYSSINQNVPQWSFTIYNKKIKNKLNLILEDQNEKTIYYFVIESGTIKEPEKIFNQRNDEKVKNASIIIIPTNDKNFTNRYNNKEFQFRNFLKRDIKYNSKSKRHITGL